MDKLKSLVSLLQSIRKPQALWLRTSMAGLAYLTGYVFNPVWIERFLTRSAKLLEIHL